MPSFDWEERFQLQLSSVSDSANGSIHSKRFFIESFQIFESAFPLDIFDLPMLAAQQVSPCSAPLGMRIVTMLAIVTVIERAICRREQSKIDFPQ